MEILAGPTGAVLTKGASETVKVELRTTKSSAPDEKQSVDPSPRAQNFSHQLQVGERVTRR
jgi:hypothetical protein